MGEFHSSSRDVDPLEGRPIGGVAPSAWAGGKVEGAKGSVLWRRGGEARGVAPPAEEGAQDVVL